MGKNRDKIRVSFPSASAESVAGSQVLIQFGKDKDKQTILVECGLIQGETTVLKEYQANTKKFAFKPKDLTAVFVCHLHADHGSLCGRLYKEGCDAPLIMPTGSKNIYKEMLLDSVKIFQKDSEYLTKKFNKNYPVIYNNNDVVNTLNHVKEYERREKHVLNENVTFEFVNSGHIINSCQLILWIKGPSGGIKKIVITSDLGNRSVQQYYVDEFEPIESANLLIGETTYCSAKRSAKSKDREKDLEKIKSSILTTCIDRKGSVLIPAFSIQRFQVLLTHLYDLFYEDDNNGKINMPMIYAASPLACKISNLFDTELRNEKDREKWEKVKSWNKIKFINDFDTMQYIVSKNQPSVYVASAGMLVSGYSTYIASQLLPKSNNMILFCGYMAEGSIGSKIKEGKSKTITIDGKQIANRCNIISLNSFTSHMQYDDLLWYYSSFNFDKICLVHGNFSDKVVFAKTLQEEISKKNKTGKVVCVNKSTEICL